MSKGAWLFLGLGIGIQSTLATVAYVRHLDAQADRSTRAPGSTVVNLKGRDIELLLNRHRRETGRKAMA